MTAQRYKAIRTKSGTWVDYEDETDTYHPSKVPSLWPENLNDASALDATADMCEVCEIVTVEARVVEDDHGG